MMENTRNYDVEQFGIIFNEQEMNKLGYEIIYFQMIFEENKHTIVKMKLEIKKSNYNDWDLFLNNRSYMDEDDYSVVLHLDKRKYFAGVVQKITKGIHNDGGYHVDIELVSQSIIMDRSRYIMIYQNSSLSYLDIIKYIAAYYDKKVSIIGVSDSVENNSDHNELNEKIENGIIVQYNESDWEFLIRILSHLGLCLYNSENGGVQIGFPKNTIEDLPIDQLNSNVYETVGKMGLQKYKIKKLETTSFYVPGDKLNTYGYISSGIIMCKENKFYGEYTIKDYDYTNPYIYNENIKGVILEGRVKRIPYDKSNKLGVAVVTVDFIEGVESKAKELGKENGIYEVRGRNDYISLNGNLERWQFPYVTPFSKTKTGLFCTPEVGDKVLVYFGTNNESSGYVLGAAKNERSERFSNPFVRNYTTTEDEVGLFKALNDDLQENDNTQNMLKSVEASIDRLIDIVLKNDKYRMYVKTLISEESDNKSSFVHEKYGIVSKDGYSVSSDTIDVTASSMYNESASVKSEDIDSKKGIYNSKEEISNRIAIVTNVHSIKGR